MVVHCEGQRCKRTTTPTYGSWALGGSWVHDVHGRTWCSPECRAAHEPPLVECPSCDDGWTARPGREPERCRDCGGVGEVPPPVVCQGCGACPNYAPALLRTWRERATDEQLGVVTLTCGGCAGRADATARGLNGPVGGEA